MGEKQRSFNEKLSTFMAKVSGEKIDIAAKIYFMLIEEEDASEKLRYFLEKSDEMESSEEEAVEQHFMPRQVGELREKCEEMIKSVVSKLIKENREENEFYKELWEEVIIGNPFLKQEDEKIYALYCIWMDGRIPYFKLESGIRMTNQQFREISITNKAQIKKAFFIVNSDFSQKTEKCSLLNKILDSCESEDVKAVVLAQILNAMAQKLLVELMDHEIDQPEED